MLDLRLAHHKGLDSGPKMKCLSLNVYSELEGVWLIAAVSSALAEKIPSNVVSAYHHNLTWLIPIYQTEAL